MTILLPHTRQSWEIMTSISAGHIILTPNQPVGSGRSKRKSNQRPPHQEPADRDRDRQNIRQTDNQTDRHTTLQTEIDIHLHRKMEKNYIIRRFRLWQVIHIWLFILRISKLVLFYKMIKDVERVNRGVGGMSNTLTVLTPFNVVIFIDIKIQCHVI